MKRTELVLDPSLPAKTWERRSGTNRVIKRCRYELTEELLTEAMDDPKTERIAFGEEAHAELRRLLAQPGLKTPTQRSAEEAAGLRRGGNRVESGQLTEGQLRSAFDAMRRRDSLHVDRSTFGGFEPEPPGTTGPGGVAS